MADDSGFFTNEISASDLTVLIVDPASSFGQVLVGGFIEMGCDKEKICNCKKYSDALELLNSRRPMVLLTEYMIDGKPGMELAAHHATLNQNKVSILITHNTSASAVAEAAEELVDDYLIKPFSMGNLIDRLKILIRKKLNPSPYVSAIRKGKELVKEGNYVAALEEFKKAEGLEKKPTLAYYYLGNTYFLQGNYEQAVVHFKKGLNLQPLHYKCLLGEFDAYF